MKQCGNTVKIAGDSTLRCTRQHGHPVVGIDAGRGFDLHEGDGYLWDDRCAWPRGQEPVDVPRKRR